MKLLAFVVAGLALLVCAAQAQDSAARVDICETLIVSGLLSPASYKRVRVTETDTKVTITYDASNPYGALLRAKETCAFINRPDGVHLAIEPALSFDADVKACIAEYDKFHERGNIDRRTRDAFVSQFCHPDTAAQSKFLNIFTEAGVTYPGR